MITFKQFLNERDIPTHLKTRYGGIKHKVETIEDFKELAQQNWPNAETDEFNNREYHVLNDRVVAMWDMMTNRGYVYQNQEKK